MSAPTVRRVETERGSHVEPPLDPDWDPLTRLRWHLAVVLHDNDVPADAMQVRPAVLRIDGVPVGHHYQLNASGWSVGALNYSAMWDVINGVEYGIRIARATS